MRRKGLRPFVFILVLAIGGLVYTFSAGNSPLLGLDLQGGVSVVLAPRGEATDESIDDAIEVIRTRVDALGVAEPDITRQGDNILIQIPGVKDKQRALDLVGQTAKLVFRPVLQELPAAPVTPDTTGTTGNASGGSTTSTPSEGTTTTTPASGTTTSEGALGLGPGESAGGEVAQATTTTTGGTTTSTTSGGTSTTTGTSTDGLVLDGVTPREENLPDQNVTLGQYNREGDIVARFWLGPVELEGTAVSGAQATLRNGQWEVVLTLKEGEDGIDGWNQIAQACFNRQPTCPSGRVAIVLDDRVQSAPTFQTADFTGNEVQITGSFTEREAKDLALVLRYGALPVDLEPQTSQAVSATLGQDALRAGLISGLVGFVLVTIYMIAYYRLLGVVVILTLGTSAALLWTVISFLGETQGLALTLAGVTGIIVSIGISADSNVVYFEHLKEDVKAGRSLRATADRSFAAAYSTIVKADVASLIGAILLYVLTVGPVRGFAFYLALATILDLISSYFFMRPLVGFIARSPRFADRPGWLGLPKGPTPPSVAKTRPAAVPVGGR